MAEYIHVRITLTFLPLQFFKCKFETFLMDRFENVAQLDTLSDGKGITGIPRAVF